MKQLTDTERKDIAVALLDKQGLEDYERLCSDLEHDCERK